MTQTHYDVLGVARSASADEIQHAFRALALRYHPDRNGAADAASRMTAINEAWEVLGDSSRRRDYDAVITKPSPNAGMVAAVLAAAREIVLRGGWRVVEDGGKMLLLERAKERLRIVFADRIDNAALLRLSRQSPEYCVAMAAGVEGPIQAGTSATVIDLMNGRCHGAALPDGPVRSLVAAFL